MTHDPPEENESGPAERPLRYTLSALFGFVGLWAVLLGLATKLAHIGVATFCFIAVAAAGWWCRRWRLSMAALTGLLVFIVAYLACWVQLGYVSVMDFRTVMMTQMELHSIHAALSEYSKTKGELPASLRDLANQKGHYLTFDPSGELPDSWGNAFHYRKTAQGFELFSLGRDGKIGGLGLDADIYLDDEKNKATERLPLSQFLFETRASRGLYLIALLAGLAAAGIIGLRAPKGPPNATASLIAAVAITTISAVVVAVLLAAFDVGTANSGH